MVLHSLCVDWPAKIAEKAFDALFGVLVQECTYVIQYRKNVDELDKQLNEYESKFEGPINDARYGFRENDETIIARLQEEEKGTKDAAKELLDAYHKADQKKYLCFNPFLRRKFGKKAIERRTAIEALGKRKAGAITRPDAPPGTQIVATTEDDYLPESRAKILSHIMEALANPNIQLIGVWGAPRMGKTVLRKKLVQKALGEKLFDIRAESEKADNVQKIQDDLADDLILDNFSLIEGANKRQKAIRTRLMNNKNEKVLIILDGLSKKIDLSKVGIPLKDRGKVCKVVLMSADENLLVKEMGVPQENLFQLGMLSDTESIDLFQKTLKKGITNNRDKKVVMEKLVKECKGLPDVIVEQADNLKNKHALYEWNDALKAIRSENDKRMLEHIENILKPYPNQEELRSLIYLCGLIGGPTILVQDLVTHGRGMTLFSGVETVAETRDRVKSLLRILHKKDLVDGNDKYVKIKGEYDRVFTLVQSGPRDRHCCILRSDGAEGSSTGLNKCSDDELRDCTEMSIDMAEDSDIQWIKELGSKCPKLKMLLLRGGDCSRVHSLQIPIDYFTTMKELTVLHLININFTFSSLSSLGNDVINLKTLCLECCQLEEVCCVEDLKQLEHLSFSGSDVVHLPKELGKLTDLRMLDLRGCHKLQVIEFGVLESLTNLEELYLDDNFSNWEVSHEGVNPHGIGRNNGSLDELNGMKKLSTLQFHVPDATKLPTNLPVEKLDSYKIVVGNIQEFPREEYEEPTASIYSLPDSSTRGKNLLHAGLMKNTQHIIPRNLSIKKLENYDIVLRDVRDFSDGDYEQQRTLKLSLPYPTRGYSDFLSRQWMKHTLERSRNLYLRGEIENFHSIQELSSDGFLDLEHLHVQDSPTIECIVKKKSIPAFQNLVSLTLANLTNLKKICYDNPNSLSFKKLKCLKVHECCELEFLLKVQLVHGTPSLEEIEVTGCKKMKGIVSDETANKIGRKSGTEDKVIWRNLRHLSLHELDEAMSFITTAGTDNSSKSTLLDNSTAFFDGKQISLPTLESLALVDLPWVKEIWLEDISPAELGNLQHLHVERCKSLSGVIKDNQLTMLQKLRSLTIKNCPLVKEAFQLESVLPHPLSLQRKSHSQTLAPGLFGRRSIKKEHKSVNGRHGNDETGISSNLVELKLIDLQSLECIWKSTARRTARFQNLSQLTVRECGKLKYLLSTSMARGLPQMRCLCIENCEMLEVIINGDTENEEAKVELKMLKSLSLENLQSLATFSRGIGSISFPSLKILKISNCPKPTAFYNALPPFEQMQMELRNGYEHTPEARAKLDEVAQLREKDYVEAVLKEQSLYEGLVKERALFEQKVSPLFPSLEHLAVSGMDFQNIWQGQISEGSFPKLSEVSVEACRRLSHVFQQEMLKAFLNIQTLHVSNCSSLEKIFAVPGPTDGEQIKNDDAPEVAAQLRNLFVKGLEKLEHIWPKIGPDGRIITFGNLEQVSVSECKTPEYLFPASMMKDLSGLQTLEVNMCDGLEQLIQDDPTGANGVTTFNFRDLKSLRLQKLGNLKNLYSKQHISRWPTLTELMVVECHKVQMFGSTGHDFSASDRCLFWVDKNSFSKLEILELNQNQLMRKIWQGQLSNELFHKLRAFKLASPKGKPAVFPHGFLQWSAYLEKLEVSNCQILEPQVEQSVGVHEEREILQEVPRMAYGSEQVPQSHTVVLQEVHLNMVPEMQFLHEGLRLMGASAFYSLMSLDISECESLKYLLTISMAERLPHLSRLTVAKCNHMEEIVAGEKAKALKNVVLESLKCLTLDSLPNIKCFSTGMSIFFHYSSLEEVIVTQCPKMEKFTRSYLEAPKLEKVKIEGKEKTLSKYHHDLNAVIKASYAEMDAFPGMENVKLNDFPDWAKKWGNLPVTTSCNMQKLEISGCPSLLHAVPSKLIHLLALLGELQVSDCNRIEIVFDAPDDNQKNGMLLPELYRIHLKDLPELQHIWRPHHFPGTSNLQKLQHLIVQECNSLKSIFTWQIALSLPLLKEIEIKYCMDVEYIISCDNHERLTNKTEIFPRLEYVFLVSLPSLESFHADYPNIHCPSLKYTPMEKCPKAKGIHEMRTAREEHYNTGRHPVLQAHAQPSKGLWFMFVFICLILFSFWIYSLD